MNAGQTNNKLLNSLIPPLGMFNNKGVNSAPGTTNSLSVLNDSTGWSLPDWTGILIFLGLVAVFITLMIVFRDQIEAAWKNANEVVSGYFSSEAPTPAPQTTAPSSDEQRTDVTNPAPQQGEPGSPGGIVEKVLPGGGGEVFNVSSNKYTYYDAEPLCKALGAELATYDQVKEAWSKGADWCNYGWTKGQMAVYPTSDETYQKLQAGPEEQRLACGRPGLNGGYFDNPEMRYGVNCYGKKPPQSRHDEWKASQGAPVSPDALAFDKKVAQYKSEADHIGILPFNSQKWD
jgi:hypothetical protein